MSAQPVGAARRMHNKALMLLITLDASLSRVWKGKEIKKKKTQVEIISRKKPQDRRVLNQNSATIKLICMYICKYVRTYIIVETEITNGISTNTFAMKFKNFRLRMQLINGKSMF